MNHQEKFLTTARCYSQQFPLLHVHEQDLRSVKQHADSIIDINIIKSERGHLFGHLCQDNSNVSLPFEGLLRKDSNGRFHFDFNEAQGQLEINYSLQERSCGPKENRDFCYLDGAWHYQPFVDITQKGLVSIEIPRSNLEYILSIF
jgi:hypothetical protein